MLQDILAGHTSPEDAGSLFYDVKPKMAVFNHLILMGVTPKRLEMRTRKTYSGPLKIGQDLMTFVVDDKVSIMNR